MLRRVISLDKVGIEMVGIEGEGIIIKREEGIRGNKEDIGSIRMDRRSKEVGIGSTKMERRSKEHTESTRMDRRNKVVVTTNKKEGTIRREGIRSKDGRIGNREATRNSITNIGKNNKKISNGKEAINNKKGRASTSRLIVNINDTNK